MARVERYTTTEPVTVKRAGMIDPSDFRFSNISAQMLQMGGEVLYELGRRELEAKNSLAINAAVESRSLAKLKMREFMANNPDPDTWSKGAEKILAEQGKIYSQQRFNAKTKAEQEIEQQAFKDKLNTEVGIAAVTQNIENDIAISGKNLIDVISTDDGLPEMAADILDQQKTYQEALERKYPKDVAAIHMEETLKEAQEQQVVNAINDVHAAMEIASDPINDGNFEIARELAKNPVIPESKQTTLRNAIRTAETVRTNKIKEERDEIINKTTSNTIREYFNGELSIAILNERHEKGLIKDSEFKIMRKGLDQLVPENSNPFAAGRVRRAQTDFSMGAITRAEADKVYLENFQGLDKEAREIAIVDLEDIEEKIIATAKSNAYSEGKRLMSLQFVGIESQDEFARAFLDVPGLTDEEKKRINRRWDAELANRDLYEKAVNDRFKEMRREKVSDIDSYQKESLKILLQYRNRSRLKLEEFEAVIVKEEQRIVSPSTTVKPISEMTTAEKQRELERIRELKRLAR